MSGLLKSKFFLLLMLLFALGGGAYFTLNSKAVGTGTSAELNIGTVKRGDLIQRVTIAGVVVPNRRTIVAPPYQGYVRKIFVKIGDMVKQGDSIVSVVQSLQSSDPVYPLRAPFPGTVVQVQKSEGEYVKDGDPKDFIVRIDDLTKLFVTANAPEIDRAKIKLGQDVVIKASAVLTRSYKGVIRELSLAAREADTNYGGSRTQVEYPIRVEIIDQDEQLSPGMSVVLDIIAGKKEKVLILGHEFIHKEGDKFFVIMSDGTKRAIEIAMQNEEASEITSGLKEGERVQQIDFSAFVQGEK